MAVATAKSLRIVVPGEPVAKERPRVNMKTRTVYTPKTTKAYEQVVALTARAAGVKFGTDRLIVDLGFKVTSRKGKDIDNLIKAVLDGLMKGGVLKDDRQVVELHATVEVVDDLPGVTVAVRSF